MPVGIPQNFWNSLQNNPNSYFSNFPGINLTGVNQNTTFAVGQQYGGRTYKDYNDQMVKEWTTDSNKGDKSAFTIKDGQILFPIWKQESELAGDKVDAQANQFLDPNSQYYRKINKQITSQLTGAFSPNSLLALTFAAGGNQAQAQEQMKAMRGRIGDMANQMTNQYYLGAANQGTSLLQGSLQNSQYQETLRHQLEQYRDSMRANQLNQFMSMGVGLLNLIPPGADSDGGN